ncbi:hypothetical protein NFI96_031044 [Prochilodus magdalenae]|nr:hypothetical protein NFI96_031044 [Prochilodus magdalenae]
MKVRYRRFYLNSNGTACLGMSAHSLHYNEDLISARGNLSASSVSFRYRGEQADTLRRRKSFACENASIAPLVSMTTCLLTVIYLAKDLLHPTFDIERRQHKKKRLVQSPNSYFMDVKCPGCYKITTVFSHAQTVVLCVGCSTVLCQPTGGKARLTEGCSFRRKQH